MIVRVAALLIVALLAFAGSAQAQGCTPDFGGKYSKLLGSISVPEDVADHGPCKEFGRWGGGYYAGHRNTPEGYWVYVAPNWYIWAYQKEEAEAEAECSPDQDGKYSDLAHKLHIPDETAAYGSCFDYGRFNSSSYREFQNLEFGYWVYVKPHWYIWRREN
jgi:hypothetical protein